MDLIFTNELTKEYAAVTAVDCFTWSVPEGSLCGLLGPNGAGKTTLLKMLLGMTHATSGSAEVLGLDMRKDSVAIRKVTAFVSDDKGLYDSMTVGDLILFYSKFFQDWSYAAMEEFIRGWKLNVDQRIHELSKGTRAKLYFALAIARRPRLLILDEPTEGLDPVTQEEVLELLTQWLSRGSRSAVIASHRLEEIERVCDRVAFMNQGKLLLSDDLDKIKVNWKTVDLVGDFTVENSIVHVAKSGMVSRIVTDRYDAFQNELRQKKITPLHVYDMNLRDIYLASLRKGGLNYDSIEAMV
jgi:ABC-2 type transport system ATP-binding protein